MWLYKDFNAQRNSFALYFTSMGFVYEANDFFSPFLSEIGEEFLVICILVWNSLA